MKLACAITAILILMLMLLWSTIGTVNQNRREACRYKRVNDKLMQTTDLEYYTCMGDKNGF